MSTITLPAPIVKPSPVEIKGASYTVEAIEAGEFGTAAYRVVKLVNGEAYDVIRTHAGAVECSCPDWVVRHSDKGTCCKHGRALMELGLLDAPAPAPRPSAFAPITRKDLARASAFGIKLPDAPRAVEPAPVVAEAAPEIPAENPRDSWPDWTDQERWEPTPEPASDIDLTSFAVPARVVTMDLPGPVVTDPARLGLPEAVPPMAWVELRPGTYGLRNTTPIRTEYPAPPARPRRFEPTLEERAEAAALFADPADDMPAPRRPSRMMTRPRPTFNGLTDADLFAPGCCS
jgi:hypothetical protein